MSHAELYDLIPRVFWNAVDGYWLTQENTQRKEWERIRWQTCCLINVQLPRNKQMTLHKLMKFDWETDIENDEKTYEETMFEYEKHQKRKKVK